MLTTLALAALLAQTPATQPEPLGKLTHAVIAANVAAHFLDVGTSLYAFGVNRGAGQRRFQEANPLLGWAEDQPFVYAATKAGVAIGQTYLIVYLHKRKPKLAIAAGAIMAGITSWVAYRNHQQIEAAR